MYLPGLIRDLMVYLAPALFVSRLYVNGADHAPSSRLLWVHALQNTLAAFAALIRFPITRLLYGLSVRLEFAKRDRSIRAIF